MSEEKEWTSLSGCVKKEGLSNEQKFVLLAFRPEFRVYAKDMSDQETVETLVTGIYGIAKKQANPRNCIRGVISALEVLERGIDA